MSFETDFNQAKQKVDREYLSVVVNSYRDLFIRTSDHAGIHMNEEGIDSLDLSPKDLEFRSAGGFYNGGKGVELIDLPRIYQEHFQDIIDRNVRKHPALAHLNEGNKYVTIDPHRAMIEALQDFRKSVREFLHRPLKPLT
jgi:hypothetical protein